MTLLLLTSLALADIPPPDDYVETCTVAVHGVDGRECAGCSADFSSREQCEKLEKQGYESVCRTHGASTWDEVLCRGKAKPPGPSDAPTPSVAKQDEDKGCAVVSAVSGWMVLAFAGLFIRRRER